MSPPRRQVRKRIRPVDEKPAGVGRLEVPTTPLPRYIMLTGGGREISPDGGKTRIPIRELNPLAALVLRFAKAHHWPVTVDDFGHIIAAADQFNPQGRVLTSRVPLPDKQSQSKGVGDA